MLTAIMTINERERMELCDISRPVCEELLEIKVISELLQIVSPSVQTSVQLSKDNNYCFPSIYKC